LLNKINNIIYKMATPRSKLPGTPSLRNRKNATEIPEWHHQQELILKRWSEIGSSYRYLHDKAYQKFHKKNLWFALPVIIISTITGTANFAQNSFPESAKDYAPLAIGFFNLAAGLITTVAQFLRVSELLEGHRAASIAYSKFSRNIGVELSLPVKERTDSGSNFINNCRATLDRLIEQSPNIPEHIVNAFVKRFPEPKQDASGNLSNHYNFFRPEILDIRPITIYRDNEAEIKRKKEAERIDAVKRATEEENKFKKLLEERERQTERIKRFTLKEYQSQQEKQQNDMQKIIELASIKAQQKIIKSRFNTVNIEENMSDLLGSLKSNIEEISDYSEEESDTDIESQKILSKKTTPVNLVITEPPEAVEAMEEDNDEDEDDDSQHSSGEN